MSERLFVRREDGSFEQIATEQVVTVEMPVMNLTQDEATEALLEAIDLNFPEVQAVLIGDSDEQEQRVTH